MKMKIRKGFVSNSSSSSFVVISKEPLSTIKRREENSHNSKYIFVDTAGAAYSRSDIALCRSLEDKIRHFAVLYAIYYEEDKDYFVKMDRFQSKIEALGEKYGYKITIACPPLSGYVSSSSWDQEDPEVVTFVDIPNECNYAEEVARIIENEDTTELESYLFNPHSFCVLGGNEYSETFKLAYKMRKFVDKKGYKYRKFGDITEDHEEGDPCPWDADEVWGTTYHWGTYKPKIRISDWFSKIRRMRMSRKLRNHKW